MENFNQFFSNIGNQESILLLSWLVISFLLGLLAGYFLRNRYVKELSRQLEEKEQQFMAKQAEVDQAQQELALRDADLQRTAFEAEEHQIKLRRTAEDNLRLNQLVASAQSELEKTKAAEQASASMIQRLKDEISGLKSGTTPLSESTFEDSSEAELSSNTESLNRLAAIEIQLAKLSEENLALLRKLDEVAISPAVANKDIHPDLAPHSRIEPVADSAGEFFVPKTVVDAIPERTNFNTDSSAVLSADRALLRNVDKNDLTAIQGIGPFLEKKLNDVGVFTYADIASWDAAKIVDITQQISFFEGRIEKDDWVGQAKKLLEQKSTEANLSSARDLQMPEQHLAPVANNLKLILGVNEEVEKILFTAGISSFAELARMNPDDIRNILVVVNPALGNIDPSAWPAQARLAFDEEWEVLQDYQEQLKEA